MYAHFFFFSFFFQSSIGALRLDAALFHAVRHLVLLLDGEEDGAALRVKLLHLGLVLQGFVLLGVGGQNLFCRLGELQHGLLVPHVLDRAV